MSKVQGHVCPECGREFVQGPYSIKHETIVCSMECLMAQATRPREEKP